MKVVVLDRDGVINEDSDEYVKSVDEWIPIEGSIEAIAQLCEHGFTIAVATNQSGIGRGYYSEDELEAMHEKMQALVESEGGQIATIAYCPHVPEDLCDCRKPQSGLFDQIADTLGCDLEGAWVIGDSLRDLLAGTARGLQPILVRTGKGLKTEQKLATDEAEELVDVPVFDNLQEAAAYLIDSNPPDIVQEWLDQEY